MYDVKRHGGRASDVYRTVLHTEDEAKAREKFNKIARDLRQGRVVLMDNGFIIDEVSA